MGNQPPPVPAPQADDGPASNADHLLPERVDVAGQELCIYSELEPMAEAMERDIRSATSRVWMEVYILMDDKVGRRIAAAMMDRAKAGVEVKLLYDAFGSAMTPQKFFDQLAAAGVRIHAYHTVWEALARGLRVLNILNSRNHRKLVVVDDKVAYFGGMNVVEGSTLFTPSGSELPTSAGWRDVHVRLQGSQQAEIARSFDRSWRRVHRKPVEKLPAAKRRGLIASPNSKSLDGEIIEFFDSGPGRRYSHGERVFRRLFRMARLRLLLSMAYFLPPGGVFRELRKARRRGVDVTLIIPAESDVKLVQWATQHAFTRWLKAGLRIFERENRMLHSKVLVVDDQWSVVGSCNLDARSLRINLEFLAVVRSKAFAQAISRICEHELAHSRQVTVETCRQQSWWCRLRNRFAYLFRWWL